MTNADKIRSMSDKDLATFLATICEVTDDDNASFTVIDGHKFLCGAFDDVEEWLGQEVDDES